MIASALKLNRADCKALKLTDAYSLHRIVYSLFPQKENETRDFLYADKGGSWNCRVILILSERNPLTPEFGEVESKEIPESFLSRDRYGFEVTVNPVRRNGPSKKTTPIRGIPELHQWFIEKAPSYGFKIDEPQSLQVCRVGVVRFEKNKNGFNFKQTHGTATFIGKLKVTDREVFKESFKKGIGRAKGFGFGLFQIVPIQKP